MMERGPLTKEETEALDSVCELADQIKHLSIEFDKYPRHIISDAANLIRWVVYDYQEPGDPDSQKAIDELKKSIGKTSVREMG